MPGNGRRKLFVQVLLTASSLLLHSPLAKSQNAGPPAAAGAVPVEAAPDVRALPMRCARCRRRCRV